MVTKRQMLDKFKVVELKDIAKDLGLEVSGKKADLIDRIGEKVTKDDIFGLKTKISTPKLPFDISNHRIVPKHELLTPEQEAEVLKQYNCTKDQLPRIKYTDSGAKSVQARPGNIIKIIRDSKTAGIAIYYRVVIA
ncbi:DNA-directed RNA polymerase subunit H [Candidatus Undinarchaeota archaeon]